MRQILLVSHGTMAEGVYEAASMIYGTLNNVDYLCLKRDMGIENFKEKLNGKIDEIGGADEIIVLADLMGGSPYNSVATILSEKDLLEKSKILSGMNLPLLLTLLFETAKLEEATLENILNTAKDGISVFQIEEDSEEDL